MPMLCLAGSFRIRGTQPDGDSVRFVPDDPELWARVPGTPAVRTNVAGGAQLRLDAIDALETHYSPPGSGPRHQPLPFAHAARDELLEWLGFRDVTRDGEVVTGDADDAVPGFVLTRGTDRYGRCVALAGRGAAPVASGASAYVDVELLTQTANHHLITTGLAYPTFYLRLWPDLRGELAERSVAAREASTGLWAEDRTLAGVTVSGLDGLSDAAVILPKLFRRLADYLTLNGGDPSLAGFAAYLAQRDDRVFILSTGHYTGFDFVVAVDGQTVRLTRPPEDLVFQEA